MKSLWKTFFVGCVLSLCLLPILPAAAKPHVVLMIGEDEYHTWETLPEFAKSDLTQEGYRTTVIHASAADKNDFPGLVEALRDADALFVSVRRRTPRREQLAAVRAHLQAGKPYVGIRTTCHAFSLREKNPSIPDGYETWPTFDTDVLGSHYIGHYGGKDPTRVSLAPDAARHPALRGVDIAALAGNVTLYKVRPLEPDVTTLLMGAIPGQPAEPVAWVREYGPKRARIFFTSLGGAADFQNREFRRLLTSGLKWSLAR